MAIDATYQAKVYMDLGGDTMTVASGGKVDLEPGAFMQMATGSIMAAGSATVAAASVAGLSTTTSTFALCAARINSLILCAKGIRAMATA